MTDTTQHIDPVEECARAMYDADFYDAPHHEWEYMSVSHQRGYRDLARAVLARLTQLGMLNEKGLDAMKARNEER